jgi:hypothetical protein
MSKLTDPQKIVLRGLSAVSWKRPAEIRGYKSNQQLYAALQQLVKKGIVESRPRNIGTGDSKEYRIKIPDDVSIPEVIIRQIKDAAEVPLRRCIRCGERVRIEGETVLCDGVVSKLAPLSVHEPAPTTSKREYDDHGLWPGTVKELD